MNVIAKFLAVSACAIGIASPLASFAQAAMDHSKMESAQAPAMTDGEIKKIDQTNGKVTIKHGHQAPGHARHDHGVYRQRQEHLVQFQAW